MNAARAANSPRYFVWLLSRRELGASVVRSRASTRKSIKIRAWGEHFSGYHWFLVHPQVGLWKSHGAPKITISRAHGTHSKLLAEFFLSHNSILSIIYRREVMRAAQIRALVRTNPTNVSRGSNLCLTEALCALQASWGRALEIRCCAKDYHFIGWWNAFKTSRWVFPNTK